MNDYRCACAYKFLSSIIIVTLPIVGRYREAFANASDVSCSASCNRAPTYLLSHVRLEILICGDVHADAAVLQPRRLDLVVRAWDSRHDDVRERKTFLQRQR